MSFSTKPQHTHHEAFPRMSPMRRFWTDLDFRDTCYVYPVTMVKAALGERTEEWAETPFALRASFQEHALETEHTDPQAQSSRYVRIFTRWRNRVHWHDKIVCRGIEMMVIKVFDRFDNFDGTFHHTEIRATYLNEQDSINLG